MMKKIIGLLTVFLIVFLSGIIITACGDENKIEEKSRLVAIDNDKGVKTELDGWIEKNFTKPYGVKVIYKYDDTKIPQEDYATPVSYDKAVQMANILKYLFFEPYEKFTSKQFIKKFVPKEIVLMGSSVVNPNNTEKLGLAESGVRFTLFKINRLNPSDAASLFSHYFRTIYHEFSHILHQTEVYSAEFKKISAADYVRDSWNTEWEKKSSLEAGFISDYSTKNDNEDFVELIAHYLTFPAEMWQKRLEQAAGKDGDKQGKAILEKKIKIVKAYMMEVWKIDMDKLRDEILLRAKNLKDIDINKLN